MDQAVMLMKVGAGLSLVGLLFTFVMRGALRDAVEKASANSATHLTATQIDAAVAFAFGAAIVSGLVGAGLWWWMASANGQGKKWARLVATVLFALNLLGFLGSLVQAQPVASRLWALLLVLLGGYVIVLLYKKQSTAYYDAQSAPRL
jgi:Ca2+/Na+ antiporter